MLQAAKGVPDEADHGYAFKGTCKLWIQQVSGGEVKAEHGFITLWGEAKASWDGKANTLTEKIKLNNPGGSEYSGEVETVLKCAQDPLLFKPNCVLVQHKNTTGWEAFSDAPLNQKRPVLAGKTTLEQAAALSQKKDAPPPPPPPPPNPETAGSPSPSGDPSAVPHKVMRKPSAGAGSEAGPRAESSRVPVPGAVGRAPAAADAARGGLARGETPAAVGAALLASLDAAAGPWRHCLAQFAQTGLTRDACDGRFQGFLQAVPSGDLAAAQQAFEVVRDATAQQESDDKKYWAAKLRAALVAVPEGLTAYLVELDRGSRGRERSPQGAAPKLSPAAVKAAAAAAQATLVNVEGEDLTKGGKILLAGGRVAAQPMAGFGAGWSGDGQLFWSGGAVGAVLDLLVDVPAAATYAVELYVTRAPDYGQVKVQVEGQDALFTVDGYAPRVFPPTPMQMGKFSLGAGQRKVSFMIVGKNPQSSSYLVGIDRVRLYPAGPP